MKRTPLRRKTPLKARKKLETKTRLKPTSKARAKQVKEYQAQKDDAPPIVTCALCGVDDDKRNMDPHHLRGREGRRLLTEWVWVHRPCHEWIEQNREAAAKMGLLLSRSGRHDQD